MIVVFVPVGDTLVTAIDKLAESASTDSAVATKASLSAPLRIAVADVYKSSSGAQVRISEVQLGIILWQARMFSIRYQVELSKEHSRAGRRSLCFLVGEMTRVCVQSEMCKLLLNWFGGTCGGHHIKTPSVSITPFYSGRLSLLTYYESCDGHSRVYLQIWHRIMLGRSVHRYHLYTFVNARMPINRVHDEQMVDTVMVKTYR